MSDRRLLTYARDQAQAEQRRDSYRDGKDKILTAEAEQVGGRWAVTAAKTKKEGR